MYTRIYKLMFPKEASDQPIIYRLVKQFDVQVNILRGEITPQQEGNLILEFKGEAENVRAGLAFLREQKIGVELFATKVSRDDEQCFQCGACTGVCPVEALHIRRSDMAVLFDPEKCTGCGLCVRICPVKAMTVSFDYLAGAAA
ncbi:MAG: 4Fe-4S binding protein [Desulfobulbaceae bacterium]|nr:4Fe-4S binding protein [Desulfobulbaceae bacterium]